LSRPKVGDQPFDGDEMEMARDDAHHEEDAETDQNTDALHLAEQNQDEVHGECHQEDVQTIHPAKISK
jgi:hypothetical protein